MHLAYICSTLCFCETEAFVKNNYIKKNIFKMIKCFVFYVNKALKYSTVIGNQSGGLMLSITLRLYSSWRYSKLTNISLNPSKIPHQSPAVCSSNRSSVRGLTCCLATGSSKIIFTRITFSEERCYQVSLSWAFLFKLSIKAKKDFLWGNKWRGLKATKEKRIHIFLFSIIQG